MFKEEMEICARGLRQLDSLLAEARESKRLFDEVVSFLEGNGFEIDERLTGMATDGTSFYFCPALVASQEVASHETDIGHEDDYRRLRLSVCWYYQYTGKAQPIELARPARPHSLRRDHGTHIADPYSLAEWNVPDSVAVVMTFVTGDDERMLHIVKARGVWFITTPDAPIWHEADLVAFLGCRLGERRELARDQAFDAIRVLAEFFNKTKAAIEAAGHASQ